jgi:hypothetical protein
MEFGIFRPDRQIPYAVAIEIAVRHTVHMLWSREFARLERSVPVAEHDSDRFGSQRNGAVKTRDRMQYYQIEPSVVVQIGSNDRGRIGTGSVRKIYRGV